MHPTITTVLVVLLVTVMQTYSYINPWHLVLNTALALLCSFCLSLMMRSHINIDCHRYHQPSSDVRVLYRTRHRR